MTIACPSRKPEIDLRSTDSVLVLSNDGGGQTCYQTELTLEGNLLGRERWEGEGDKGERERKKERKRWTVACLLRGRQKEWGWTELVS